MEVREIENADYQLTSPGHTFDGRYLFAPAAAWLAKGEPVSSFGRVIGDPIMRSIADPIWQGQSLVGQIEYVDRFGNLISNITVKHIGEFRNVTGCTTPTIRIGERKIGRLVTSYTEGQPNCLCALVNSNGFLELFIKEGSAADSLDVSAGEQIYLG